MVTTPIDHGIGTDLAADLAATALTLARRFSAGGTMWSVAPSWQPHAKHIAVEFVHPVIVGKRALPAVALTGPDLVDVTRVSVRPGDIVIAVAGAADPDVRSIMRRAPAWGATTVWIGSGERPDPGAADHVLWIDDDDPMVPATGGFVLLYHLLWELTHVCFEHPGLLAPEDCTEEVCITCSDDGRLGEVITARADGMATVRTANGTETVETVLVGAVAAGDLLLVHAGTAIGRSGVDEKAQR
jgi:hydrogenase maturation factor